MKNIIIAICFLTLLVAGCSKDDPEKSTGGYELLVGKWVPYEIDYASGNVYTGPFPSMSIFGVYAESIQFNSDSTYVPVIWTDNSNFQTKDSDSGTVQFNYADSKLRLVDGTWDMDFTLTKWTTDELWLNYTGSIPLLGGANTVYKLRKK